MDKSSRFGTRLEGPVSSDAIEEALSVAWGLGRAEGSIPSVRASVLSLIVFVADARAVDQVFDALDSLSRQHPSRTIVLIPDLPDAPDDQCVWYSAECVGNAGQGQLVCSERVVIAARGHAVRYLAPLTDQLMLADLPAALWWVGDFSPQYDALSERLAEMVDRLFVDSGDFRVPNLSFARVNWIGRQGHLACAVSDLNWTRLIPLRELVAQFFSAPAYRRQVTRLDRIHLQYADNRLSEAQSLLLLGWLASRLDWRLEEAGRFSRPDGKIVSVRLERDAASDQLGLRRVALVAGDETSFLVARQDDDLHALTEVDVAGSPPLRRIVRFETPERGALLATELMFFGRDRIYEDALSVAVALIRSGRHNVPRR